MYRRWSAARLGLMALLALGCIGSIALAVYVGLQQPATSQPSLEEARFSTPLVYTPPGLEPTASTGEPPMAETTPGTVTLGIQFILVYLAGLISGAILTGFGAILNHWLAGSRERRRMEFEKALAEMELEFKKTEEKQQTRWKHYAIAQGYHETEESLRDFDLADRNLAEMELRGADLTGANLSGANLSYANLQRARLVGANLQEAKLINADLQEARLVGADLAKSDLMGAQLEGADLWGARLKGANLGYANLEDAKLRDADLEGAQLWGANIQGANLQRANLEYANLLGARLDGADLREARLNSRTLMPNGWREIVAGQPQDEFI